MKKTFLIAVTLLVMLSMVVLANGNKENSTSNQWGPGRYAQGDSNGSRPFFDGKEITLTGTVKLVENDHPQLVVGKETYELMYPYMYSSEVTIKDGQKITVKGYDVPAYRDSNAGDEKHLMVQEATIDGKKYVLHDDDDGPMGRMGKGGRGGNRMPMGGRGRW